MSSNKLAREDLWPLEKYAEIRTEFRAKVIAHKKKRVIKMGNNATLHFEDRLTMHYQVQEMLRAGKVFEAEGINEELDAYNPLIPDGSNWKATFMIEFDDTVTRPGELAKLIGIEDRVWMQVGGGARIYAIADEDMDRETEDKTSSVHFLRFELSADQIKQAKAGAVIGVGIDHDNYRVELPKLADGVRESLVQDLK